MRGRVLRARAGRRMNDAAMRRDPLGLAVLSIAVLVLGAALLGSAFALDHDHGPAGFYDPSCPIELLATFTGQGVVPVGAWPSFLLVVAGLAAWHATGRPRALLRDGPRLRAPPAA